MNTKMYRVVVSVLFALLCVAGTAVWTGCDTASSTESLVISPSSVALSSGQSQTFTVSGGYHYTWVLEGSTTASGTTSSAQGWLSSLTGSQVLYTAPASVAPGDSVLLTVTSTIEGSGSRTSNSPTYEVTGSAIITFK
jgi:hypothetical protein